MIMLSLKLTSCLRKQKSVCKLNSVYIHTGGRLWHANVCMHVTVNEEFSVLHMLIGLLEVLT